MSIDGDGASTDNAPDSGAAADDGAGSDGADSSEAGGSVPVGSQPDGLLERQPGDAYGTKRGLKRLRRRTVLVAAVLILIVAAGTTLGIWRLIQFTPEPVNLDDAKASVQANIANDPEQTDDVSDNSDSADSDNAGSAGASENDADEVGGGGAAEADAPDVAIASVQGEWVVDTQLGTFDYESATGSFAGFRVEEELVRIGRTTAVGRTGEVSGSLEIEDTTLVSAVITVDLSTITTNDSRRDAAVHRALNSSDYPLATFELTQPVVLGDAAISGEHAFVAIASGLLTLNGVSVPTDFEVEGEVLETWILVIGSANVTFSDFGVTTPSAGIVAQADDFGVVEFQLLFRRP